MPSVTYKGLEGTHGAETPHLGGNIKVGDPYTYCPTLWDYVIRRFGIESVLDIGSGSGNASQYFFKRGLKVIAVDGYGPNVERSIYPAITHDLTTGPIHTRVDLVHCQEVVEHIQEQFLDNLLGSMLTGKIILMTHAVPGQQGHHHVNCQRASYWINHLVNRGCDLLVEDTRRIREFARQDGAVYMNATGMIFINKNRI